MCPSPPRVTGGTNNNTMSTNKYTTKDSGKRQQFDGGGQRDTQDGKPRFDLLFPKGVKFEDQLLTRWAELMERGAQKYDERNWEKFRGQEELDRAHSSALRHLLQWMCGKEDEDHASAVLFNILAGETIKHKMEQTTLSDYTNVNNHGYYEN